MLPGSSLESALPNESIPILRIARYACYALTVYAAGLICATIAVGVLDVVTAPIHQFFGPVVGELWWESLEFVREAIRAFVLLVALGVFLTQFE